MNRKRIIAIVSLFVLVLGQIMGVYAEVNISNNETILAEEYYKNLNDDLNMKDDSLELKETMLNKDSEEEIEDKKDNVEQYQNLNDNLDNVEEIKEEEVNEVLGLDDDIRIDSLEELENKGLSFIISDISISSFINTEENKVELIVYNYENIQNEEKYLKLPTIEEITQKIEETDEKYAQYIFKKENNLAIDGVYILSRVFKDKNIVGELSIPKGYVNIGDSSFEGNKIEKVIGEDIKYIGKNAFNGNNISEIDLPNVEVIYNQAFLKNNIKDIKIKNIKEIGERAFLGNEITSINLPEVLNVGIGAFRDNSIKDIKLPKVENISDKAFFNNELTEISIPNAKSVGKQSFMNNNIEKIILPNIQDIGIEAFRNNIVTDVEIDDVKKIQARAFINNNISNLKADKVHIIGDGAFLNNNITSLNLPDVQDIGKNAFRNNEIVGINLPKVSNIGDMAFMSNKINELKLSEVNDIGTSAFADNEITELILGKVDYIGDEAFYFNYLKGFKLNNKPYYMGNNIFVANPGYNDYVGLFPVNVSLDENEEYLDRDLQSRLIFNPKETDKIDLSDEKLDIKYIYPARDDRHLNKSIEAIDFDGNEYYCVDNKSKFAPGYFEGKEVEDIVYIIQNGENGFPLYADSKNIKRKVSLDEEPSKYIYGFTIELLDKLIQNTKEMQIDNSLDVENIGPLIHLVTSNENIDNNIILNSNNLYESIKDTKAYTDILELNPGIEDQLLNLFNRIKSDERLYSTGKYYTYINPEREDKIFAQGLVSPYIDNKFDIYKEDLIVGEKKYEIDSGEVIHNKSFMEDLKGNQDLEDIYLTIKSMNVNTNGQDIYLPGKTEETRDDIPLENKPELPREPENPGETPTWNGPVKRKNISKKEDKDKLNKISHFEYIEGYPDSSVRPENNITREEVSAVFYRLLTEDYKESIYSLENNFTDLTSKRWSNKHISTLANGNILTGYEDGEFKYNNFITRAEVATIASRFEKLDESNHNFTDVKGHWAEEYIASASKKGWVEGYKDGSFKPDEYITRAEFVTLVNRVLNRGVKKENILEGIKEFKDLKDNTWYYEEFIEAINGHTFDRDNENDRTSEKWLELKEFNMDM